MTMKPESSINRRFHEVKALSSLFDAPLTFYIWPWNWGTRLLFDAIIWSKLQIPVSSAFYVAIPFNWDNNYFEEVLTLFQDLAIGPFPTLSVIHTMGASPQAPFPSLCHMTPLIGSCSITSKTLSRKTATSSRMMIYFQLQTRFVNTVINEERHESCIPLAGPLKKKHAAFQHRLA